jgi:C4-type Zn-finger protein
MTEKIPTLEQIQAVECPVCGSLEGVECELYKGVKRKAPHVERVIAAMTTPPNRQVL